MRRIVVRALCVLSLVMVAIVLAVQPALSQDSDSTTLTADGTITYEAGDGRVLVDPDLTITADDGATLDAAAVSVGAGFEPSQDMLGIGEETATDGAIGAIQWRYNPDIGVLRLSGRAAVADYQAILRSVTFSNSNAETLGDDRTVLLSIGSVAPFGENGHFYEFVAAPRIGWNDARAAAADQSYAGLPGYLVTVTSASENDFVADTAAGVSWIGASDDGHDKEWRWKTGPEAGTHFFSQATDADGCGKGAAETQPPGDQFENWDEVRGPEPNDFPDGCPNSEDYGSISQNGLWNDWPETGASMSLGYIVEYGGTGTEPRDAPVGTVLIQAFSPSITIENTWIEDDPQLATSFAVTPDVDGCTVEQTVALPAGEQSIEVDVAEAADDEPCTYTVTATEPPGYTVSPQDVTGVAINAVAAFTNTPDPMDALPTTGSTNSLFIVLGVALAGSGCFALADGRRRLNKGQADTDGAPNLLPVDPWTKHDASSTADHGPHGDDAVAFVQQELRFDDEQGPVLGDDDHDDQDDARVDHDESAQSADAATDTHDQAAAAADVEPEVPGHDLPSLDVAASHQPLNESAEIIEPIETIGTIEAATDAELAEPGEAAQVDASDGSLIDDLLQLMDDLAED